MGWRIDSASRSELPDPHKDLEHHLRVLLICRDRVLRSALTSTLRANAYTVSQSGGCFAARGDGVGDNVDLLLLEIGLADLDGLDVIDRIRQSGSTVPIVVMSSWADEAAKVQAFDLGADDYLTKPFGIEELLARIRALWRYRSQPVYRLRGSANTLTVGDLQLDLYGPNVSVRQTGMKLAPKEHELLRLLMTHAGKVLTHDYILRNIWHGDNANNIQYLRIYVSSIRQKIELDPKRPRILLTEQGIGYTIVRPVAA
jgi:two-component system KDP operon response regulator KdpE